MIKNHYLLLGFIFLSVNSIAQMDTASKNKALGGLAKIVNEVKEFKPDTSNVPDDRITRKIIQLRSLKGGFNINSVLDYKLQEEETKKEMPDSILTALKEQFQNGKGNRWLNNAIIWIYRREFTYKELKQLVKFFKTSAGQKLSESFPAVILKSLMSAEVIQKQLMAEIKK